MLLQRLLCALLWANIAAAAVVHPLLLRAAATTSEVSPVSSSQSTSSTTASSSNDSSSTVSSSATASSSVASTSATSISTSSTISSAVASSTDSTNSTAYNSTIPDGQLPLQPELTPGWGVAGIIMLLTGAVYGLIGIKRRWLHICFSTAFLASLGTTVLIVYIMSVPINDAVQGAYVVAVVCTGLILGGLSLIFKDITESLGCMLGGFCFGMWLFCLKAGGLVTDSVSKIIFIIAFTMGIFAFYFTRWTRQYALIGSISFSGATVTVLGIDTFSRAGLKEFWAYIWALNDNLFPLGADTYPLTKGIRVEIAVTIILFIAGVISQMKLWRVVQERREKRDAKRIEGERAQEQEEENIGRQIEETTARERQQWEAMYGDKNEEPMSPMGHESTVDSDVGDMESEKRVDTAMSVHMSPNSEQDDSMVASTAEPIEMDDLQQAQAKEMFAIMEQSEQDGAVTVRVAQDDYPEGIPPEEPTQYSASVSRASAAAVTPQPEIVPLPFRVPEVAEEADEARNDNRSSVATFDDEDGEVAKRISRRRQSLTQRLSQSSVELLQNLSQQSKRASKALSHAGDAEHPTGERTEELVLSKRERDDSSSLAATIDGISSCGDEDIEEQQSQPIEVKAELGEREEESDDADMKTGNLAVPEPTAERPESAMTVSTSVAEKPQESTTKIISEAAEPEEQKARSIISADSTPSVSLTKERLPQSLSRIALSYRTNEWAKHLSHADTPEPESLKVEPYRVPPPPTVQEEGSVAGDETATENPATEQVDENEAPRPLNVAELQQTAMTAVLPVAAPKTQRALYRQSLEQAQIAAISRNSSSPSAVRGVGRRVSGMQPEPIVKEGGQEQLSDGSMSPLPRLSPNLTPVPGVISCTTPQTLIGKREMLLRSKSQQGFYIGGSLTQQASFDNMRQSVAVMPVIPSVSAAMSDRASIHSSVADLDDLPMRQRREVMRQQSSASISGSSPVSNSPVTFNSHQPKRPVPLPTPAAREAQLATFRNSVALDLHGGSALQGRESAISPPNAGKRSFSPTSLQPSPSDLAYVQQSIETQRNALLSQKEAEAQRRSMVLLDRERNNRAFEERMRRGDLMDAHRDAMRKLQASARDRLQAQEHD